MEREFKLHILTPVFNDWAAAALLLQQLDQIFAEAPYRSRVLLVDDGSNEPAPAGFPGAALRAIESVEVLSLYRNLGHQRALCCGMVHLYQQQEFDALLILDADGEDHPRDALRLVQRFVEDGGKSLVFAARGRRTENAVFRLFYQTYRSIHRIMIGFDIRVGNFSVIPPRAVAALVRSSGLWNHYAAAASRARLPIVQVPIDKAKRLHGESRMNFIGLVIHGFRAFTVHIDTAAARTLVLTCLAFAGSMLALLGVFVMHFGTNIPVPEWTPLVIGLGVLTLLQTVMLAVLFTLGVLMTGATTEVIPLRDCPVYIEGAYSPQPVRQGASG